MGQKTTRDEGDVRRSLAALEGSGAAGAQDVFSDLLLTSPPLLSSVAGEVREGFLPSMQTRVLIKIVAKSAFSAQEILALRQEYELMAWLAHPHILRVYAVRENAQHLVIVTEYFSAKRVETALEEQMQLRPEHVMQIVHDISLALKFLHHKQILHRDVKLENILFDGKAAKLAGFRHATALLPGKRIKKCVGSPEYVSPESLLGKSCAQSDFWSLGVCMYRLLTGDAPFADCKEKELFVRILEEEPDFDRPAFQGGLGSLAQQLLAKNWRKRASEREILYHCELFFPLVCRPAQAQKRLQGLWEALRSVCPLSQLKVALLRLVAKHRGFTTKELLNFDCLLLQVNPDFNEFLRVKELALVLSSPRLGVALDEFARTAASLEDFPLDNETLRLLYLSPKLLLRASLAQAFADLSRGGTAVSLISLKKSLADLSPKLVADPAFLGLSSPVEVDREGFAAWADSLFAVRPAVSALSVN